MSSWTNYITPLYHIKIEEKIQSTLPLLPLSTLAGQLMQMSQIKMFLQLELMKQIEGEHYQKLKNPLLHPCEN